MGARAEYRIGTNSDFTQADVRRGKASRSLKSR